MLNTVIFDLDGTLLPMDLDKFIHLYFSEIDNAFREYIDPEKLKKYIYESTMAMLANDGSLTNEKAFLDSFSKLVKDDIGYYITEFDRFYDNQFLNLRSAVDGEGKMAEAVNTLKGKGYTLAIATNPLFPRKAILHRIEWAGLNPDDFAYISSYEINSYSKPSLGFYKEVLSSLNKEPEQCIMVGNDVQEDLCASKLGLKTFLIKDYLINRGDEEINANYQGYYEDFLKWSKKLNPLY